MELHNLVKFEAFEPLFLSDLIIRFLFNIGIATVLILFVYKPNSHNKEFTFTLFSFNMIIFALCTILNNIELSIGSGFGLFAVFTMMRYRSEQLQIKDMTYLLIVVCLGFINSTFQGPVGPFEITFLNIAMVVFLFVLEKTIFNKKLVKQKIKYEKLELLKVSNKKLLRQSLEERIGAHVEEVKVESVNYLQGSADLIVKYNRDQTDLSKPLIFSNPQENGNSKSDHFMVKGL